MSRIASALSAWSRACPRPLVVFLDEIDALRDIFNDAWADNWGFVPFTAAEFHELGRNLRFLVDSELIQIAEVDGVGGVIADAVAGWCADPERQAEIETSSGWQFVAVDRIAGCARHR